MEEWIKRYRIDRTEGQHSHFVECRKELLEYLSHTPVKNIMDIRKVYKNGITDSVMDIYLPYGRCRDIN